MYDTQKSGPDSGKSGSSPAGGRKFGSNINQNSRARHNAPQQANPAQPRTDAPPRADSTPLQRGNAPGSAAHAGPPHAPARRADIGAAHNISRQAPRRQSRAGAVLRQMPQQNPYGTYKLIGALAVVAAVIVAVTAILFAGGAASDIPASAGTGEAVESGSFRAAAHETTGPAAESAALALTNSENEYTVCIDPGHGYDDPGAVNEATMGEVTEKEVDLAVALMLRDKLESAGVKVLLTRPDDIVPSGKSPYILDPFERVDFVRAHPEIDLFISLHCDTYIEDPSVGGTRIYTYANAVEGTAEYAAMLSGSLSSALSADVPVISKDYAEAYYVTKVLPVPAVLIEMGFITNPADAANLLSDEWRDSFAYGAAAGIIAYLNSLG